MKQLQKRRSSLFANLKIGDTTSFSQSIEEEENYIPFALDSSVKQWTSAHHLGPDEEQTENLQNKHQFLNINVGGSCFKIVHKAAAKFPKTRIGKLATMQDPVRKLELCDDYSVQTNEYFFDRNPQIFHSIFHFYQSGTLWIMDESCPTNFVEEIRYWGLHIKYTQPCCRILFEEKRDELKEYLKIQKELQAEVDFEEHEETFQKQCLGEIRRKVWNLMKNPYSSISAKLMAITSSLFVLISVVAMTLSTVQELQIQRPSGKTYMEMVENICIVFFTVEYLLRIFSAPKIKQFLKSVLNTMDLFAVLPFYIQFALEHYIEEGALHYYEDIEAVERVGKLGQILKIIRLTRIFRILKLARHSTGLRAFGFTLRQCYQQVCCLLLFIAMGIFTFSALIHSVEHDVPGTNFSSIPSAWWWAAVSISTVGYGDTTPETLLGRIVAFGCISFGIILNGMPISILFNKFSDYYTKLKEHEYSLAVKERGAIDFKRRAVKKLANCCNVTNQN
ncbi:potassium voltage-gated channel subfamily V member 2-like [Callorhinchus milii]|uniref:Potassium voltage-gated channel subfamily V member 2-like n=1 Tax=Callorhinchus milii TaxID=7868 RepID=A0A4W3J7L0_CALMI|nr:potassium voltage-gated channel subfamily V member 2-like [Callorhinchus milii]|eukprot:gi/632984938/ref/XP_007909400.1/ PREDICTED: potassium voltage-gated channel subfamily V member 2-like [Callorhinchus milii]